ncbi:MAG: MarP family serine protease [Chloroflexi bacterium]|nr:MarP family serine protease [Chloroflexota bacterium]
MNLFDLGAVVLLFVAVGLGFRSGALPQIGGLAGAVAGAATAILVLPLAEDWLLDVDPVGRAIIVLAGLLLLIGLGEGVGSGAGRAVGRALGNGVLGALDRLAGGVLGAVQALLIVWLAGGLLAAGPVPRLAAQAQTSTAVRSLAAVLPPPTEIAVGLGRLLDASGLPDVFVGLEPLPAPPVDRPDDPRARAIAAVAEGSTVKVTSRTCGGISTGSGFAVANGYVVTNAHVVAGGEAVRVGLGRQLHDATVVLFDPDLDIALLRAPELAAAPLRFATDDPRRGAVAAALGFPGGGPLTTVAAAVTDSYPAQGRDIYGQSRVTRPILELRANVERGNSGGPLMLVDGTVGGVVFAEARTDEDVGYALSGTAVAARIRPGLDRTAAVETGACLR